MAANERRMGFFDHVAEFRSRAIVVIGVVLAASLVAYPFTLDLIRILVAPLGLQGAAAAGVKSLAVFSPMEAFLLRFKVGVWAALLVTSPLWLYEVLAFITPALKTKEKKWFFPGLAAIVLFFLLGVVFCYRFILASSFGWMLQQGGGVLFNVPNAQFYVKFVTMFLVAFGLAFETPVVVIVLVKLGVVGKDALFKQWRWAVIIIMFVATFATPDWSPVTMIALAAAMLVLYLAAALVARFI